MAAFFLCRQRLARERAAIAREPAAGYTLHLICRSCEVFVPLSLRKATLADVPALQALIARSARGLSTADYRPAQIEGALKGAFGVDTQLLADQTYFVVEEA